LHVTSDERRSLGGSGKIAPGDGGDGLAAVVNTVVKKAPEGLGKPASSGNSDGIHPDLTLALHGHPADWMITARLTAG
jgi:hypothetical protein